MKTQRFDQLPNSNSARVLWRDFGPINGDKSCSLLCPWCRTTCRMYHCIGYQKSGIGRIQVLKVGYRAGMTRNLAIGHRVYPPGSRASVFGYKSKKLKDEDLFFCVFWFSGKKNSSNKVTRRKGQKKPNCFLYLPPWPTYPPGTLRVFRSGMGRVRACMADF